MKTLTPKTITLVLASFMYCSLFSQTLVNNSPNAHLKQVMPLVGKWSGEGWIQQQDGTRVEFNQTEDIYTKLDGKVLVVNGMATLKSTGEKVFEAMGILNYSKAKDKYFFNTYTLAGEHSVAEVEIGEGKFDWWFKVPNGGTVKYTINFTETTWSEDGVYSADGENWYPFFHMDLTKDQ
ncbi:MAG: hypothetical protein R3345_14100 [Fulvivirga sp.]|nr:hypothetical protein [Fulvivirga sp.]